ncbi:PEGA domain-containing protein [Candidatus Saccharibacteria bacterium]|nr:PEGA domain-containing protein [Candidatus Saccharibacteria bacterium]MCB9821423.1 PEGA domain-containing protein [Candidatus Nomurabacteria bacterium]
MEFLDPNYRKRHDRMLIVGYLLLGFLLAGLTIILVLVTSGYDISRRGEVIVNSIAFVNSTPSNSQIYLDKTLLGNKTDARLVVESGEYLLELKQAGYFPWSKNVWLKPQKVGFYQYPFLFPEKLDFGQIAIYKSRQLSSQSPDKKWLITYDPSSAQANLFDISQPDNAPLDLSLEASNQSTPASEETNQPSQYRIVSWADDNRTMLVKKTLTDKTTSYSLVDSRGEKPSIPISVGEDRPVKRLSLVNDKTDNLLILYANGELIKQNIDTGDEVVIALEVLAYNSFGKDVVVYIAANHASNKADVIINENFEEYKLTELNYSDTASYSLALSRFNGKNIYAVGSNLDERFYVYKNPLEDLKSGRPLILLSSPVVNQLKELKFSQNSRFVAALTPEDIVVYDAEQAAPYRFQVDNLADDYHLSWMDGHRLMANINHGLNIFEFDGKNMVTYQDVDPTNIYFNKDYDTIYITDNQTGKTILESASLRVN